MLVELHGKAGTVCNDAKQGKIRCPLIVRPTSEDQITGEIFQTLRAINPRYWLPQLLNRSLGAPWFQQQIFRKLEIELWVNQPCFPAGLLPWKEGSTQVDVVISWENPPTTVFIEMKYGAKLSPSTTHGQAQVKYPSDQLIRNIRVGLWRTGWIQEPKLWNHLKRDFVVIVNSPLRGSDLVQSYRNRDHLIKSLPCREFLSGLPAHDIVGELGYGDIASVLAENRNRLTLPERILVDDLSRYLKFKLKMLGMPPSEPLKTPEKDH
jgi:hypothetical protein